MLEPDVLTIVAPLKACKTEETRRFIRNRIDPGWVTRCERDEVGRPEGVSEGSDTGMREGDLKFSAFPGLHCCAFIVVDSCTKPGFFRCGTKELPAYLIMEATIDCTAHDFVRDLVDHDAELVAEIFRHCEGFPKNAAAQPGLLVDFLCRKAVGYNTYFSGVPGKSVSEIRSESDLRQMLTKALKEKFFPRDPDDGVERPKARFHDILRDLRNQVRNRQDLNLAEERPSAPWSVRNGKMAMGLLMCAVMLVFGLIGYLILLCCGVDPQRVLVNARAILDGPTDTHTLALVSLLIGWFALRAMRIGVTPEARPRLDRALFYMTDEMLRFGLRAIRLGLIALGLAVALHHAGGATALSQLSTPWASLIWAALLGGGVISLFRVKKMRAIPLRRFENGSHILPQSHFDKATDGAVVDVVNLVHLIWYLVLLIWAVAVLDPALDWLWPGWIACAKTLLNCGSVILFYVLFAFLLMLLFKNAMMGVARYLQWCEDRRYDAARKLAEHNMNRDHIWAREEHRTHTDQNHFASETLVKGGLRMLYLRVSLLLVNIIGRYHDNKGKLGGIPTIFSARWLLLDGGHRLIFLTNYIGAWDSYLGEFSDLNAYVGVNAIWTNTYLPLSDEEKKRLDTEGCDIGFPTSRFMLFGGACLEQPFKAYVRQSQVETLAWYGAYPGLSVPNIHDNARIRRDLFRKLKTHELDALFRRI